jgi:hypothetical protein
MQALTRKSELRPFLYGPAESAKLLMLNGRISSFVQMHGSPLLRENKEARPLL